MIFEVSCKLERKIRLTDIQWVHIKAKHSEVSSEISKITETLQKPDFILYCMDDDNYQYYKFYQQTPVTQKHMLVIVKILNGDGFVITAFFVRRVRKEHKEAVYGKETLNQL